MKNKVTQASVVEDESVLVNKPNGTGFSRIFKATQCSFRGFSAAWQHESAFRQELILVMVMLPFAFVLSSSTVHLMALIGTLLFVLFAEIINSAIEALADAVTLENNILIGRAKDMGSSAVFIALTILTLVWLEAIWRFFS
ncbi:MULTISPECIES: diacylglycerol kinase [Alteromonadaceae]|uniref:diacylglycerol kinase n=1 Tax=Alteromonadaceae TaxID=72275 RepID=UPI001C08315E|nr:MULTISPECIES: diacylglycerol kinase [Aliiglaciecola]MBU2879230.1 diacylglycerol kinase [Aliiglaciecola lipolytica]MDO6710231.1 diacylglycerol kinase [Aliiglaciecola sp. 2_MG-2023]MDO6751379.1 diacylglycerol kinase [Aliiglaciecola sp. 1_MG-2023]